jgi:hypothetical protein
MAFYIFSLAPPFIFFSMGYGEPFLIYYGAARFKKIIKDFLLVVCVGEMVVVVLVWWTRSVCARAGSIESTPSSPSIHFSQKGRGDDI